MKMSARSSMAELRAYTSAVPGSNPGGRTNLAQKPPALPGVFGCQIEPSPSARARLGVDR